MSAIRASAVAGASVHAPAPAWPPPPWRDISTPRLARDVRLKIERPVETATCLAAGPPLHPDGRRSPGGTG